MTKLYFAPASPFARKVRVVLAELGLEKTVEPVTIVPSPVDTPAELAAANPLGKIPALALADGTVLYDSTVICEYLDAEHGGGRLIPREGAARWAVRRREALANGMAEAGVLIRYETAVRPEERRWPEWIDSQRNRIRRGLDALDAEAEAGVLGNAVDMGTITAACALGYLDFRFADMKWRDRHPRLAVWYERWAARPSMRTTAPA